MSEQLETQDLAEAKKARDAALKSVAENGRTGWRDKALQMMRLLGPFEGTAEDIRIRLKMKGLDNPHHHNAWGEVTKAAVKAYVLIPTGELRHMRTTKSHARLTPVYRIRG